MINPYLKILICTCCAVVATLAWSQEDFGSGADFGDGGDVGNYGEDTDLFGPADANLGEDYGLDNATPSNSIDEVNPTGNGNNLEQYNETPENDYGYGETNTINNGNGNNTNTNNTNTAPGYNNAQGTNAGTQYQGTNTGTNTGTQYQGTPGTGTQYQGTPILNQQTPGNLLNEPLPQQTNPNALLQQSIPSQVTGQGTNVNLLNPAAPEATETLVEPMPETIPEAPPLPLPNEFSGAPAVPGTMRNMADGEAPEEYFVQYGDSLFDICDQLLDEPAYWPKLWALNPEIKNPHFIWPGMKLQFYPGDDQSPPYLQIVSEDDVIPIDTGDLVAQELVEEPIQDVADVDNLAPTEVIGPEELVIPDELADLFQYGGKIYDGSQATLTVPGFIYNGEVKPLAKVVFGREGEFKAGPDQLVFVERVSGLEDGARYSVIRPVEALTVGDQEVGTLYYFVAHVQNQRNLADNISVVQVTEGYRDVRPDDMIVEYTSTRRTVPDLAVVGAVSEAGGAVVYFNSYQQSFAGIGDYVFLGGGSYERNQFVGVSGTSGFVYLPFSVGDLPADYRSVGVVRIVDTTDAGAVGVIVQAQREIRIGDRVGG